MGFGERLGERNANAKRDRAAVENRHALSGRGGGQVRHLVDSAFVGDQVPGHQFVAGGTQFVGKTDVQQFRQTRVGVKADPVLIGDGHQDEVEQLFQAG